MVFALARAEESSILVAMRRAALVVVLVPCLACVREEVAVSRHVATSVPAQAANVLGGAPAQPVQSSASNPGDAMTPESLYQRGTPTPGGFRDVSPDDVARAGTAVKIVDVRQPAEFTGDLGHIPGATLVPLGTLPDAARDWDRDAPVVLVCRSGRRSSTGAAELVAAGFTQVMNLDGGMVAYGERGLPVAR